MWRRVVPGSVEDDGWSEACMLLAFFYGCLCVNWLEEETGGAVVWG